MLDENEQNEDLSTEQENDVEVDQDLQTDDEWSPNFNYDVKGESKEFDEWIRDSIKSKEDEEKARDLYTRADGLNAIKEKADKYESEYTQANSQIELMSKGFNTLKDIRDNKDIDKLIDALGASEDESFQDAILDWAIRKADFINLPQEEQQKISSQNGKEKEMELLRSQVRSLQENTSQTYYNNEISNMRSIISSSWSELNDSLKNVGIDFENEVLMNGTNSYKLTGKEPTIEEAIQMTASKYGFLNKQEVPENAQVGEVNDKTGQTLPRVRRNANSSVNDSIRSIDDLKKLAARMGA